MGFSPRQRSIRVERPDADIFNSFLRSQCLRPFRLHTNAVKLRSEHMLYPAVSSVTRPTLQICCSKGAVMVQWPTNACMYSLETKWPSPTPSTWSTLTNGIHIEGS